MLEHFFARPIHEARHCQDARGRRDLMAQVRAQIRHFEVGVAAGRCWWDGLRSRELRAEFCALYRATVGDERSAA